MNALRRNAPTAVSVSTAEYKQVTVLFADVVRSMEIAATVDTEQLRAIMIDLVDRVAVSYITTAGRWTSSPATA